MMTRFLAVLLLLAILLPVSNSDSARAAPGPIRRLMYVHVFSPDVMASMRSHINDIDSISPVYFSVQANGEVTGRDRQEIRNALAGSNVKVLPMVANEPRYDAFTPILGNPAMRTKVIDQLVKLTLENNYDGLNIDFEAIEPSDRGNLNAFMVEFTRKMRAVNKLSTIAVAAKPRELTTGWAGAYDYAALGANSDYMVLMTYAYRTVSEKPGSTAPIEWVRRTVEFAASQSRPEGILMGVGLWAYDWNTTTGATATVKYIPEIDQIAARPGAVRGYDTTDQSAYVAYKETGHDRVAWYEDETAIAAKLQFINQYKIAGWAGWRLGQEGDSAWRAFKAFENGAPSARPTAVPATQPLSAPVPVATPVAPVIAPMSSGSAPRPAGARDWSITNGWFFTQRGDGTALTGYAVTDDEGIPFYKEFKSLGVEQVGYPISHRFVWNGLVTQAFQKSIFQWNATTREINFVNVFDELTTANKNSWLKKEKSTPMPFGPEFDAGKNWDQIQLNRLTQLDKDASIKATYFGRSDAMRAFGLPTSAIEDNGNHLAIRLQRAVIQKWTKDVPWAKAGTVTIANGGEIAKDAGMLPDDATKPKASP